MRTEKTLRKCNIKTSKLGPSVQSNIRISLFLKEAFSSGPEGVRVINESKWNIHCFEMWNI